MAEESVARDSAHFTVFSPHLHYTPPRQERRMAKDYVDALDEPVHSGIKQAWILGATYGSFQVPGGQ